MGLSSASLPGEALLFVYGTLRPGCIGAMAHWLGAVARHQGPATARGALFRIDDYPGFVPGGDAPVAGDLFLLPDAPALLPLLDAYEECSVAFPRPHEYRRERLLVEASSGPAEAWVYVYARAVTGLERIECGDFLR